ncbi:MAG: SPOR domain-containing protein [Treponema sp.]|nr:SPOR domain-containing protein [Treponema sp.]
MKLCFKRLLCILLLSFIPFYLFCDAWFVCVGSFKQKENAQALVNALSSEQYPAYILEAQTPNGLYYRVLLEEAYEYKEDALLKRDVILSIPLGKQLKITGAWVMMAPYERKVLKVKNQGKYIENKEISIIPEPEPQEEELVLTENEISTDAEKPYSVLVHSYKEEQIAENDRDRLRKKDIDAYVVKTFDEDELFSFDLHAGAFETEEETEELQKKLEDLGIDDTKISHLDEYEQKMEVYNEVVQSGEVKAEYGNTTIPDSLSEAVQENIRQFPVNRDFQIESILIFDFDNIRNTNKSVYEYDLKDIRKISNLEMSHAGSFAFYKDNLFGNSVLVYLENGDKGCYVENELPEGKKIQFKANEKVLDCVLIQESDNYIILGKDKDNSLAVTMYGYGFTEEQFLDFLNNSFNDSSLLIYPQIRKSLCVLPEENDYTKNSFISFYLSQIGNDYAEEKGYADWAIAIVGHWNSKIIYNKNEKDFSVSFFDLDYDYNAKKVHGVFMNSHILAGIDSNSYPVKVNDMNGWYVKVYHNYSYINKEVSFSVNNYIIAVNSEYYDCNQLIDISESLQIWSSVNEQVK